MFTNSVSMCVPFHGQPRWQAGLVIGAFIESPLPSPPCLHQRDDALGVAGLEAIFGVLA